MDGRTYVVGANTMYCCIGKGKVEVPKEGFFCCCFWSFSHPLNEVQLAEEIS